MSDHITLGLTAEEVYALGRSDERLLQEQATVSMKSELAECGKLLGEAYQWLGNIDSEDRYWFGPEQEKAVTKLMDCIVAKLGTPLMKEMGGEEDESKDS